MHFATENCVLDVVLGCSFALSLFYSLTPKTDLFAPPTGEEKLSPTRRIYLIDVLHDQGEMSGHALSMHAL